MKKTILFIVFASFLIVSSNAQINILKKAKETVEKKTETKTETKTEQKNEDNKLNLEEKIIPSIAPSVEMQLETDYGWTDGIHEKYKGQVVLSKTSILFQKGNEAQLTKEFVLGKDDIYFMAYFENSYKNRLIKDGKSNLIVPDNVSHISVRDLIYWEVNGELVGKDQYSNYTSPMGYADDSFKKWTGLSFPDNSLTKFAGGRLQRAFNCYVVPKLKVGDNKIKMFVNFEARKGNDKHSPEPAMAIGEFILKVNNANDIVKHFNDINYLQEMKFNEKNKVEKEIRDALPKEKIKKVVFCANDWTTKTEYGKIVSRSVPVSLIIEDEEGRDIAWSYSAEQKHQGGGKYGQAVPYRSTRMDYEVPKMLIK